MKHRMKNRILSRKAGPRKALVRGLALNLIKAEKMVTTRARAKEIRPVIEKLITLAKSSHLCARRSALTALADPLVVKKLVEEIGLRYKERNGGYTRIIRLISRKGDSAERARIEFV